MFYSVIRCVSYGAVGMAVSGRYVMERFRCVARVVCYEESFVPDV